ncbi:MAG: hypothetical protein LBN92_01290 [Treponema sp.]|jgi:hypothetical protein|nr:hypothetical protein [Treponema sp.]
MRRILFLVCLPPLFFFSCRSPYEEGGTLEFETGETVFAPTSDLFRKTESGAVRFYTNDPKYRGPSGYSLWTVFGEEPDTLERLVGVSKSAGNNSAGYGLVICHKTRESDGTDKLVMLTVMINNRGYYAIGKVINGSYREIKPWTRANAGGPGNYLKTGSGMENKIGVSYAGDNHYELSFNGSVIETFTDEELPFCGGEGRSGYVVVIAPDDLNKTGVDVYFRELEGNT